MPNDHVLSTDRIYQHLPLHHADAIRLLRIDNSDDLSAGLKIVLYVMRLQDVVDSFDAISYTWGTQERDSEVSINGIMVNIGENLYNFLKCLRDSGIVTPLWADAICINQSSSHEKNHQVRLMSKIYSSSNGTRAWLGQKMGHLTRLMELYSELGHLSWDKQPLAEETFDTPALLDSILDHSYWSRTWIIQEIILAKQVWVHCGRASLPWSELIKVAKRICAKIGLSQLTNFGKSPMMQLDAERRAKLHTRTLPGLLDTYQDTNCSGLRDRVFAMVGLISDTGDPIAQLSDEDKILTSILDYTISLPLLLVRILALYAHRVPPTFAVTLWNAFQLDSHIFTDEESVLQIGLGACFELQTNFSQVSESENAFMDQFNSERAGVWLRIDMTWLSGDRIVYWKVEEQSDKPLICQQKILGSAISWAPSDKHGSLSALAWWCCRSSRHIRVTSIKTLQSGLRGELTAKISLDYFKALLFCSKVEKYHTRPRAQRSVSEDDISVSTHDRALRYIARHRDDLLEFCEQIGILEEIIVKSLQQNSWNYTRPLTKTQATEIIDNLTAPYDRLVIQRERAFALLHVFLHTEDPFCGGSMDSWDQFVHYYLPRCDHLEHSKLEFECIQASFDGIQEFIKPLRQVNRATNIQPEFIVGGRRILRVTSLSSTPVRHVPNVRTRSAGDVSMYTPGLMVTCREVNVESNMPLSWKLESYEDHAVQAGLLSKLYANRDRA